MRNVSPVSEAGIESCGVWPSFCGDEMDPDTSAGAGSDSLSDHTTDRSGWPPSRGRIIFEGLQGGHRFACGELLGYI